MNVAKTGGSPENALCKILIFTLSICYASIYNSHRTISSLYSFGLYLANRIIYCGHDIWSNLHLHWIWLYFQAPIYTSSDQKDHYSLIMSAGDTSRLKERTM